MGMLPMPGIIMPGIARPGMPMPMPGIMGIMPGGIGMPTGGMGMPPGTPGGMLGGRLCAPITSLAGALLPPPSGPPAPRPATAPGTPCAPHTHHGSASHVCRHRFQVLAKGHAKHAMGCHLTANRRVTPWCKVARALPSGRTRLRIAALR